MVLGGQDAWRKHPLLAGNWKKPLPGFGIAVGLFRYVFPPSHIRGEFGPPTLLRSPSINFLPFAFPLLISAYVVADYFFQKATAPPPSRRTFAPKVKYTEAGDIGDQMPSAKVKGGHH